MQRTQSGVESVLICLLGLLLPFTAFPLTVWRGFGIDLSHVLGAALILLAFAGAVFSRRPRPEISLCVLSATLLLIPLLPYAFRRLPGFSVEQFWKTFLHLGFMLGVFLAVASSPLTANILRRILALLAGEAVLLALYGLWQTYAYPKGLPTGIEALSRFAVRSLRGGETQGVWRATGPFEEPKWLAMYLLVGFAYAYGLALLAHRGARNRSRGAWLVAAAVLAIGVVPTGSLGEIPAMMVLAAAAVLLGFRLLSGRLRRLVLVGVIAAAALFAVMAASSRAAFFDLLRTRLSYEFGGAEAASHDSRLAPSWAYVQNLRYSLAMFRGSPWFGMGVGQFAAVGRVEGLRQGFPLEVTRDGPWVGLGGILAEFGLLGAATLLTLIVQILRRGGRVYGSGASPFSMMAGLLILAVLLNETNSGFYVHLWTWFPLGVSALASRIAASERRPNQLEAARSGEAPAL